MKVINVKLIAELLKEYVNNFTLEEIENIIEIPPSDINFNYAFPCFRLAKIEKKDPIIIAKELVSKISKPEYIEKLEVSGPYLNIRIKTSVILNNIFNLKEDYGRIENVLEDNKESPLKIVVEYPSPNSNKPLHLGHVRNMLIGSTISRILVYFNDEVFQINLNNDRGKHICKSMLAYKKLGDNKEPNIKSDHFVGDFYIKYSMMEKENVKISEEVDEMLQLWEEEEPETRALWKKMNDWALNGFNETYRKFDISFDKEYYESDLYKEGKDIILKNVEKGILHKTDDGAIIAKLQDKYNLKDKILLRSDGTSIYITQDIYLAYLKKKDFNYDKSIYVVGNEQDSHFKELFAVLDLIGDKEDKFHFSYGMISLPEGRMKSREGIVVDADDIIQEIQDLAYDEVNRRYPDKTEVEKLNRASIIGKAALRFFILKFNPKSNFIFNPKESIAFEGETGPYIQYCYARIESIMDKSGETISSDINYDLLKNEKETNLIKHLNSLPEILKKTVETYGLHLIPQYLLTLCQSFNSFYGACIVISEDKELEKARLLLIKCVQIVIKIGLNLLGIGTLNEM